MEYIYHITKEFIEPDENGNIYLIPSDSDYYIDGGEDHLERNCFSPTINGCIIGLDLYSNEIMHVYAYPITESTRYRIFVANIVKGEESQELNTFHKTKVFYRGRIRVFEDGSWKPLHLKKSLPQNKNLYYEFDMR